MRRPRLLLRPRRALGDRIPLPGPHDAGVRQGERAVLEIPSSPAYLDVVLEAVLAMSRLAGLGENAAGRARLTAEEIFMHIAEGCRGSGAPETCRMVLEPAADGLRLGINSRFLAFDPDNMPEYSLENVLENGSTEGLGLHLVKTYARDIELVQKGAVRELIMLLPQQAEDQGSRPWSKLLPALRPGLHLKPMEHQGRLVHRMEDAATGKKYLVRELAHVVLGLIDGRRTFSRIMAQALKMLPEKNRLEVEDLFEVLIAKDLVSLRQIKPEQTGVRVRREPEPETNRAIKAYEKMAGEE